MREMFGNHVFFFFLEVIRTVTSVGSCRETGNYEVIVCSDCGVGAGTAGCGLFILLDGMQNQCVTHSFN